MSRQPPVPTGGRPSDRLEELAHELELLADEVKRAVQRLKEETDHDPAE